MWAVSVGWVTKYYWVTAPCLHFPVITSHLPLALSLHTVRLTTSHVVGPGHDSDHRNKSNEAPTSWHNHGGWSTLKITFKDKDALNLGSWCLGKWMLKHRDHWSVLGWVLYLSDQCSIWSFVFQLICIWSFICVCSAAAFIFCLSASETDRKPINIFTHWKSNEMIIAVSGDFLWNILLSSFLKVFGVKDHDGDQPVCLKCNRFSIAPNTKCSWVLIGNGQGR